MPARPLNGAILESCMRSRGGHRAVRLGRSGARHVLGRPDCTRSVWRSALGNGAPRPAVLVVAAAGRIRSGLRGDRRRWPDHAIDLQPHVPGDPGQLRGRGHRGRRPPNGDGRRVARTLTPNSPLPQEIVTSRPPPRTSGVGSPAGRRGEDRARCARRHAPAAGSAARDGPGWRGSRADPEHRSRPSGHSGGAGPAGRARAAGDHRVPVSAARAASSPPANSPSPEPGSD